MRVQNDHTFAESYLFEVLDEFPGASSGIRRFGAREGDGVPVEFAPGTPDAWTGVFEFGDLATNALTGVFALPDQRVLVVARGDAYIVAPGGSEPEKMKPNPVMQVLVCEEAGLVLVADPWSVFAIGREGVRWNTGRIAIDGLSLDEVEGPFVQGRVVASADESHPFSIDLRDGACSGVTRISPR